MSGVLFYVLVDCRVCVSWGCVLLCLLWMFCIVFCCVLL